MDKSADTLKKAIELCDEGNNELFLRYGAHLISLGEDRLTEAWLFLKHVAKDESNYKNFINANYCLFLSSEGEL